MRGTRNPDHARAFQVHQRNRVDGRDPLHLERRLRVRANQRAVLLRRKSVADVDGNVARHRRLHGLRVDDLGAEIREFHGLVVRQLIDDLGIRHQPRIGRQHAVHIGPDDDFRGAEQGAEDGAGKVAAVAAQGRLNALDRGRHETGHDQTAGEPRRHETLKIRLAHGPLHRRAERAPFDDHDLARIDPEHVAPDTAPLAQVRRKQPRRPNLPITRNHIAHRVRR